MFLKSLSLFFAGCFFCIVGWADVDPCQTPASSYSYIALNGSCTITLNRLHSVSTPTIYARRGSTITVIVLNPSPFEI